MADPIYERYKEALKQGHVAVLRGRLEEAIEHYRAAAGIATDRPLPHSSLGGVLLRLGRLDEALGAYTEALARAPTDEGALAGRSDALLAAGRRTEAAEVLETLADVQLDGGRQSDALATRDLARTLRSAEGAEPAAEMEVESAAPAAADADGDSDRDAGAPVLEAAPESEHEPAAEPPPYAEAEPEQPVQPEPEPDPEAELSAAQLAAERGDPDEAVRRYVAAADGYAALGAVNAALDACQQALSVAPGAAEIHLAMARLYFARGWHERGMEKVALLDRLLTLDGTDAEREALAALVRESQAAGARVGPIASSAQEAGPG